MRFAAYRLRITKLRRGGRRPPKAAEEFRIEVVVVKFVIFEFMMIVFVFGAFYVIFGTFFASGKSFVCCKIVAKRSEYSALGEFSLYMT